MSRSTVTREIEIVKCDRCGRVPLLVRYTDGLLDFCPDCWHEMTKETGR